MQSEKVICGSCIRYACRFCLTKYGWAHQPWCNTPDLIEPECVDCRYYSPEKDECRHPACRKE